MLREHWTEWTITTGLGLNFPEFQVHYRGTLTLGTGQPGVTRSVRWERDNLAAIGSDILLAPRGPLTLREARVFTHQISIIVPISR